MSLSGEEMQDLYERTVIVRRPTYGIVSGYHELPYICLGASSEAGFATLRVRGRIHVSPRFVIRPAQYLPQYQEIFGEENVDVELQGRMFGFLGFRRRPVECKSEFLEVQRMREPVEHVLSSSLDELERHEDIRTGVIIAPDTRYYPVSVERFISSIVEDEFSV
ncbi:MAG TPA: hypothetical protein PKI11_13555 [Candidatus Hydrogenedentes bacterium]|nr:hypothetical protein [Candidatus Hydrogenedentota bacterium]HNT87624.1 hypothetical protein [Candidatus Hydrogenedentota bacterium]